MELKAFAGISVVIPVYNEDQSLAELLSRLKATAEQSNEQYQWIFVDDGSVDSTLKQLQTASQLDGRVQFISLSRNFGHQVAVSAGIEHATGSAVIVIDGDLQDPPELFPELIKKWKEGNQVVYAIRKSRKENFILRMCYAFFYRLLSSVAEIKIPMDSGDFCLMDQKIASILKAMPEKNRFIRGIRAWTGFRQVGIEYDRDKRFAGKSKYSFSKLFQLAFEGITSFSDLPIKACGYIGFAMAGFSILGLLYSLLSKLFFDQTPQGWASMTFALFFIGGVQLLMLSFVGIYVGRIYREVQKRPLYLVKESTFELKV